MSIKLQLKDVKTDVSDEEHVKLHYLPCSIDENIQTNIAEHFNNYTTEKDGGEWTKNKKQFVLCYNHLNTIFFIVLKNSLRGYPLDGCKFDVPKEYQGVVFQEIQKPLNENTDRTFKVNGIFSNFTYWNYDREPSDNDLLKQALVWNEFANVVSIFYLLISTIIIFNWT